MPSNLLKPEGITGNVFDKIGRGWMLITAGTPEKFNTMTASWGGLGVLWGKNVAFCFVRPQRYTYEFMESSDVYTLGFFPEKYRPQLVVCGGVSGRDTDKVEATGFKPLPTPDGGVYFQESELVIVCRKIYADDFKPELFLSPELAGIYPGHDYHRMYIGEITAVYEDKD
ncbi:MAG: flavin reductase [Oscillospiraceae bacterium]|nr:flavin reductase [Oscillospiraceae bacterium]